MYEMKKIIILGFLMIASIYLSSQSVGIETTFIENGDQVKRANADIYQRILDEVQQLMDDYNESASFTENGQYSLEKAKTFASLFSNGARHFNDLKKKKATNLYVEDYGDNAYEYLGEYGIDFTIRNVIFKKITNDASSNYICYLSMEKLVRTYLDEKNNPKYDTKGRKIQYDIIIQIPSYNISDGRIKDLIGTEKRQYNKSQWIVSGGGLIGWMPNRSENLKNFETSDYINLIPQQSVTYGGELEIRKNIRGEKLFGLIGIKMANYAFNSTILDFNLPTNNFNLEGDDIPYNISSVGTDGLSPSYAEKESFVIYQESSGEIQEKISGWTINPKIGLSYRLYKSLSSRIYFDLSWTPTYKMSWRKGELTFLEQNVAAYQFPKNDAGTEPDPNFPYQTEHFEDPTSLEAQLFFLTVDNTSAYNLSGANGNSFNVTNTATNFALGSLTFGGVWNYDIATNWGVYLGLDVHMFLEPLLAENPIVEEDFLTTNFLQSSPDDKFVLGRYFQDIKPLLIQLKLGAYYEINR